MDTLVVMRKPLRNKSTLTTKSRLSYRSNSFASDSQNLPPAPGVATGGIQGSQNPKICFVKLYNECLRHASHQPYNQFSCSPSHMKKHCNTPTKQISNESMFTCYKESACGLRTLQDYNNVQISAPIRTPQVDLMLEVDYNTNFYR
ncbi:unnamed protein product [Arctia plantaginis]|uniref:Uncharacterized protein n=1 Tax=Arctia plantaginis TaxID=874455 RepID=A0A8S0ZMG3_ARCPL|nr:unnamed protein product [Arctia plantaginis]